MQGLCPQASEFRESRPHKRKLMTFCCTQENQMFLHPDLPLSLTQMILEAEQTCQPHSQPGHWLTWKDVHVWLSCSQRNTHTHFYCFSLLLRFFWPSCSNSSARVEPALGRAKFVQRHPKLDGNPCGSRNAIPSVCQQNPSAASTGIPQKCRHSFTLVQT